MLKYVFILGYILFVCCMMAPWVIMSWEWWVKSVKQKETAPAASLQKSH